VFGKEPNSVEAVGVKEFHRPSMCLSQRMHPGGESPTSERKEEEGSIRIVFHFTVPDGETLAIMKRSQEGTGGLK